MRKLFVFWVLIAILVSGISAYCVCLYNGPCGCDKTDPYRSTNMTKIVNYEPKSQVYWSRSDEAEGGRFDIFEDSRPKFGSWESTIEVEIDGARACVNENILIRATYRGTPLSDANVRLYSHGGGRAYVSQVQTDENGLAVFGDKPIGKYDFVARKDGYNQGQKIFAVEHCKPALKFENSDSVKMPENQEEIVAVVYAQEYERRYMSTYVGGGQKAVRVEVLAKVVGDAEYVIERIPKKVVSDINYIGFERAYPHILRDEGSDIAIGWKIAKNLSEGDIVKLEYVMLRSPSEDTVDDIQLSFESGLGEAPKERGFVESILAFFGLA